MNQDIPLGDVNFNDITRVMIECGSKVSSEDMVNLVEMKDIIFKLHRGSVVTRDSADARAITLQRRRVVVAARDFAFADMFC